jgi:hypothetical protein
MDAPMPAVLSVDRPSYDVDATRGGRKLIGDLLGRRLR